MNSSKFLSSCHLTLSNLSFVRSKATEEPTKDESENALTSDVSAFCCEELPPLSLENDGESNTVEETELTEEEVKVEGVLECDSPPPHEAAPLEDSSVMSTEHPRSGGGTGEHDGVEEEDLCQQFVPEMKENDDSVKEDESASGPENIWDEFEELICEMIDDKEQSEREGAAGQADVMKDGEQEEARVAEISTEKEVNVMTEARIEGEEETSEGNEGEFRHPEVKAEFEEDEDLEKATQEKHAFGEEAQHRDRGEVKQPERENNRKESVDEPCRTPTSPDKQLREVRHDVKESKSDISLASVDRKLVVSKHPKVHQVKAVPVVPPKPQHCKITALTLRQQQQQRERRDADVGRDNAAKVPAEQDRAEQARDGDDERNDERKPTLRGGDRERRRDGEEGAASRNSPLSMCFDEAVALATMRREKERIRDGEGEAEGLGK